MKRRDLEEREEKRVGTYATFRSGLSRGSTSVE